MPTIVPTGHLGRVSVKNGLELHFSPPSKYRFFSSAQTFLNTDSIRKYHFRTTDSISIVSTVSTMRRWLRTRQTKRKYDIYSTLYSHNSTKASTIGVQRNHFNTATKHVRNPPVRPHCFYGLHNLWDPERLLISCLTRVSYCQNYSFLSGQCGISLFRQVRYEIDTKPLRSSKLYFRPVTGKFTILVSTVSISE